MDFRWISVCRVELRQDWFLVLILPEKAARLNWGPKLSHINLGVRPVGFDLSFELGTVSPPSVWGLCPARIHKQRLITHSGPEETKSDYQHISPTIYCDRIALQAWLKWIQQYTRTIQRKVWGWRWGQREEQKLGVGRESHCCKRGNNVI